MLELLPLFGVITTLIVGTISPGPSFVVVSRTAVSKSREHGIAAAVGMGVGGVFFATAALLGLQGVLLAVPSIYIALKVLGGIYLCYLGYRIFRSARQPLEIDLAFDVPSEKLRRSFLLGLGTQISNPKTAIVYASVFAAFLPSSYSWIFGFVLICIVFIVETGWYAIVAIALASSRPRLVYLSCKRWIDRLAGAFVGALGIKLISSMNN